MTLRDGGKKLVDQASLTLSPSIDYSPARVTALIPDLKLSLPAGDSVNGSIAAEVTNLATTPVIAFSAQFQERLVSVLKPYLPFDLGTLTVDSVAAGRLEGQTLQLTKFSSVVNRSSGELVARASAWAKCRCRRHRCSFRNRNSPACSMARRSR